MPLVDQAARALDVLGRREHWTADEDRVFVNDVGEYMKAPAPRRRFYRALEAEGLPHIHVHDLRHTFGTIAVRAFPLSDVKAFMGHADMQEFPDAGGGTRTPDTRIMIRLRQLRRVAAGEV